MDIAELRADVREALEAGRPQVELVYASGGEYAAARDAMLADGWRIVAEEDHGEKGGIIVVAK